MTYSSSNHERNVVRIGPTTPLVRERGSGEGERWGEVVERRGREEGREEGGRRGERGNDKGI